ncbi:MAG: beta-N-acetylhexosaminidase [Gammaproteobacteria bacterium]
MTLGPLMLDLEGTSVSAEERQMLTHPLVGGVILFSRNYASPEQLERLVAELHALRDPPLLVAVDHEGGRVQRFREGFTALPAAYEYGRLYDSDPDRALALAEQGGWLMAAELRAVGVDLSFAPVLDLDRGISRVIGDRAFHSDPAAVARLAGAWIRGMRRAGMTATGKHFPGHGGVAPDSHVTMPVDERDLGDIRMADMEPFRQLNDGGRLPAVMMAHVVYPALDELPASLSRRWIQGELRERLGFSGAVFCDDLSMAGAAVREDIAEVARLALDAGCDMLPVCNHRANAVRLLDALKGFESPAAQIRLVRRHGRGGLRRDELRASAEWAEAVTALRSLGADPELELDLR